jgi:hypothetical protein
VQRFGIATHDNQRLRDTATFDRAALSVLLSQALSLLAMPHKPPFRPPFPLLNFGYSFMSGEAAIRAHYSAIWMDRKKAVLLGRDC